MKSSSKQKVPQITIGVIGDKPTGVPHLPVPATDDERSQMDIANPDSFIGNTTVNAKSSDNLKVVIDDNGNPMLSPSGAKNRSKLASFGASDAAQTDYDTHTSAALPAIGMNKSN